jgi:beta-galactosidase/beta-glucuronidase
MCTSQRIAEVSCSSEQLFYITTNHERVFVYVSFGERDGGERDILVSGGRGRENETKKLNSVAFSPQANYTDRSTAACRRS